MVVLLGLERRGFLESLGNRRINGIGHKARLQLHGFQGAAQLDHGGNDASQHGKQTQQKEDGGDKGSLTHKPAQHESQAADNQECNGREKKRQGQANQMRPARYLKCLRTKNFKQLRLL